ncbi:MAG: hypothetical protein ACK4Y9_07190 [Hyphomonas sp.]
MRERRDSLLESAHHLGEAAGKTAQGAAYKVIESYVSNPMVGGIVAALAGALAGSLAPVTRTEEDQMGKLGSRALDAVKDEARHMAEGVREKKEELVDAAEDKLDPDHEKRESSKVDPAGQSARRPS